MKQYWEIKSLHQDKILLFRMGDFYEMFYDDAVKAAPLLGIALTQRNKKSQDETPMCGMPHHSVAGPINKLLSYGLKVAICDQIEDPKTAKGIVKRAVTRVLSPGMVYDPETLDQTRCHYLASIDESSVSFIDATTGESFYLKSNDQMKLRSFLEVLPVVELILAPQQEFEASEFVTKSAFDVPDDFKDALLSDAAPTSAKRLLAYVKSMSTEESAKILRPFEERRLSSRLHLSATTLRHLEVFTNLRGEIKGSLFTSVDRTKTPAGARRLREFLQFPLIEESEINARLERIESWRGELPKLKRVREILAHMGDLERRLTKVSFAQSNGRDLLSLVQGVQTATQAIELDAFHDLSAKELSEIQAYANEITSTLVEEPPLTTKQGEMIRKGVLPLLDEYIELTTESHRLLQEMESREKEKTGISSLKIRYNNVFGYYIEVTNTHKDKVPGHYQRKQTLSTAERFVTEELLELERKVITAQAKRFDLEFEIFESLKKKTLEKSSLILKLASRCSFLDVETSLAWLSLEQKYVRPLFGKDGSLKIKDSRHPVVEQSISGSFIPNNLELNPEGCLLLTGPNMAGKSTLMRQVALIALMAQIGSYVPATEAQLPVFDQIFTRVGASDSLTEGLSTFMVEMTETSEMLKKATSQSLLILDEVGRGTSTFDGMALAQAILEHIVRKVKCLTLFATHYHELTSLQDEYPAIINAHMSVVEKNGKIDFLHTLELGPATKSYGIQVAELAGLPQSVIVRAQNLLKGLENSGGGKKQLSLLDWKDEVEEVVIPAALDPQVEKLIEQLKRFPLSEKTPLDALNQIAQWQKSCLDLS